MVTRILGKETGETIEGRNRKFIVTYKVEYSVVSQLIIRNNNRLLPFCLICKSCKGKDNGNVLS